MYLSEKSLENLENFMTGFYLCESLNHIHDPEAERFRNKFHPWLLAEFSHLTNTSTWPDLIRQIAESEGKHEFDCFFHCLKKFNDASEG